MILCLLLIVFILAVGCERYEYTGKKHIRYCGDVNAKFDTWFGKVIENIAKVNNFKFISIICKPISHDHSKQSGHIKISLDILEQILQDV